MADETGGAPKDLSVSNSSAVEQLVITRGDETNENLKDKIDWESIQTYEVINENGVKMLFGDVYYDATTIVVFIRHLLCFISKEYVEDLARIPREVLEKKRIRLALIGCADHKFMKQFRKDTGYWAEFYTDPERKLYSLMHCKVSKEIGDISSSKHVKSSVITGVLKSAWRAGNFPGEKQGAETQQGGVFILGPGNNCTFARIDQNASDHYPINKLLDLVGVENISFPKDSGIIHI